MSDMIERMARAILEVKGGLNYDYADFCRDAARAALAAIREPTDKMIDAVYDPAVNSRSSVANDWRSMVEAELGEGG
jgi:hypothetical protein